MSKNVMVKLQSSDSEMFEVDEWIAQESKTIRSMIEDTAMDNTIPLPNVKGKILAKVIEYARHHVEARKSFVSEDDMKKWDAEFIKVDDHTLFDLILAANYLDFPSLLDFTEQTLADIINAMTPEEVQDKFNIINDYIPEDEEEAKRENQWAFE